MKRNCISIAQGVNIEHQNAKVRYHVKYVKESITHQDVIKNSQIMVTQSLVFHPVVVVKVNNIICRVLLDTSAGSYYVLAALFDPLKLKPIKKETKNID